ncbi:hypothetical protein TIFTF001_045924 [Ficus carica]|uniref:Uncharacterized protein n=1 Tax=Ficus carica TaxID=3494 RepID=A0AA87Z3U4_FICCA|nr:hypothetical protein TIFTF001_045918 [Ficus carica]GMN25159.1 hypothetical protein TIFTF001_045920 [Ficus carica]GMN25183.1 hypothetical protein TIFTF001_045922 [Ficus carica]GMN25198.1 hypothetical protein TIFTF001_045924 [Ficus carica]
MSTAGSSHGFLSDVKVDLRHDKLSLSSSILKRMPIRASSASVDNSNSSSQSSADCHSCNLSRFLHTIPAPTTSDDFNKALTFLFLRYVSLCAVDHRNGS